MPESKFSQIKSCSLGLVALVNVLMLRFEEAERKLDSAIECSDRVAYNYGLRAYVRIRLENFQGAIDDATAKLALKPEEAATYALRGWAFYCLNQFENTIDDISRALELDPGRKTDYQDTLRLIDCYQNLGKDREAINICDEVISLSSFEFFLLELRVRKAASLMNLILYDESLEELERAIDLAGNSDRAELHKMKADLYELKGETDLARFEKESRNEIKLQQAALTEWMPATTARRLLANLVDGSFLGFVSSVIFLYVFSLVPNILGGGNVDISDVVLLIVPYFILFFCFGLFDSCFPFLSLFLASTILWGSTQSVSTSAPEISLALIFLLIASINCIYHSYYLMGAEQATPGKRYMGVRVTGKGGQSLSLVKVLARHLIRASSSFLFFFFLFWGAVNWFSAEGQLSFGIPGFLFLLISSVMFYLLYCRPGLHNLFSAALVSDVRLHGGLGAQFGLYRNK